MRRHFRRKTVRARESGRLVGEEKSSELEESSNFE